MTSTKWSVMAPTLLPENSSGRARPSSTVAGSLGQSGATVAYPAGSHISRQPAQLLGSSHKPWTKTTTERPEELAVSTSFRSRSVIGMAPGSNHVGLLRFGAFVQSRG